MHLGLFGDLRGSGGPPVEYPGQPGRPSEGLPRGAWISHKAPKGTRDTLKKRGRERGVRGTETWRREGRGVHRSTHEKSPTESMQFHYDPHQDALESASRENTTPRRHVDPSDEPRDEYKGDQLHDAEKSRRLKTLDVTGRIRPAAGAGVASACLDPRSLRSSVSFPVLVSLSRTH